MRRKKKQSKSKYLAIALIIASIIIIAIAVAMTYQPSKSVKVSDYLKLSHTRSMGKRVSSNLIEITKLGLNLTAVGGDATSIVIQIEEGQIVGPSDLINEPGEPIVFPSLLKGKTKDFQIDLEGCVIAFKNGKCTVNITISCVETGAYNPETIAIEIFEDQIVFIGS